MNKFWDKVDKCEHKNISPNYYQYVPCGTPYCSGHEYHCLDCGVYISDCGCHCCAGFDGWSSKRRKNYRLKKMVK